VIGGYVVWKTMYYASIPSRIAHVFIHVVFDSIYYLEWFNMMHEPHPYDDSSIVIHKLRFVEVVFVSFPMLLLQFFVVFNLVCFSIRSH